MKLLLADDHTLFRDALVQYIKRADEYAEVSVAKDLHEARRLMEEDAQQDLIVLDLRMPGMNGLQGFKDLNEQYPDVPVALMSGVAEAEDVQAALDMGAVGYFPKTLSGKALLQAIQLVLAGERFIPIDKNTNQITPSYHDDSQRRMKYAPYTNGVHEQTSDNKNVIDFKLTPRESEVLSYLIHGTSNKEIANALDLQVVTIKLHVRSICQKLDVKNRTQAALKAREHGLGS